LSTAKRSARTAKEEAGQSTEAKKIVQTVPEEGAPSEEKGTTAKTASEAALNIVPKKEVQNVAERTKEERIEIRPTIVVVVARHAKIAAVRGIEIATTEIAGIQVATTAEEVRTIAAEAKEMTPKARFAAIAHLMAEQEPEAEILAVDAVVAAVTRNQPTPNETRGLGATARLPDTGIDRGVD